MPSPSQFNSPLCYQLMTHLKKKIVLWMFYFVSFFFYTFLNTHPNKMKTMRNTEDFQSQQLTADENKWLTKILCIHLVGIIYYSEMGNCSAHTFERQKSAYDNLPHRYMSRIVSLFFWSRFSPLLAFFPSLLSGIRTLFDFRCVGAL